MKKRLTQTSHTLLRTGAVVVTAGALLFNGAIAPSYASETGASGANAADTAAHPLAARNAKATLGPDKTITVTLEASPELKGYYFATLFKDGAKLAEKYVIGGTASFEEAKTAGYGSYVVKIVAEQNFEQVPESEVVLDPIVIKDPSAAGSDPGASEPGTGQPGESQPGDQPGGGSDTAVVGAPAAPRDVIAGIIADNAIQVNFLAPTNPGNSLINSYVVRITADGENPQLHTITDQRDLSRGETTIRGLASGKTYLVEVAAKNQQGIGAYKAAHHGKLTLSDSPAPKLAVSAPQGMQLTTLAPNMPNTITVAGTGYTGAAASTAGVDVVIADSQWWTPGQFPVSDFVKTVNVPASEIKNGSFTTSIVVDSSANNLQLGKNYLIGTIAAGEAKYTERRLDAASSIAFGPTAPSNVEITKTSDKAVRVQWQRASSDPRIDSYYVKLVRVSADTEQLVTFAERGKNINLVEFNNLEPGEYRAIVVSQLPGANSWDVPVRSIEVRSAATAVISAPNTTPPGQNLPQAPQKPTLRLAKGDATALEIFWFEPEGVKITGYEAKLTGSDGSTKTLPADMAADLPEYLKVTGLTPGITYTVQVRAQSADGWGEWSVASDAVTIPANQGEFSLTPPEEVFVLVDKETARATVQWIPSGYEPANAEWYVRVTCVAGCKEGVKKTRLETRTVPADFVSLNNLPAGVYKAELRLVYGAHYSAIVTSENFTIGNPEVTPDPQITVTPLQDIDPAKENTFTVQGTGFVGTSASRGIYLVVADPSVWEPGKAPQLTQQSGFAGTAWVKPGEIREGSFTATVTVPAGKFDTAKRYVVGTMAAHELSISDRTMDTGKAITLRGQQSTTPTPEPSPEPETPQPLNFSATANGKAVNSFTVGEAVTIDLQVTGAANGEKFRAELHSEPLVLGEFTVTDGAAKLVIDAATAAKFVVGEHTLRFFKVADPQAAPIVLPWQVKPATADNGGADNGGADNGNTGDAGNTGNAGNAGNAGDAGNTGNTGNTGSTGNTGNAGSAGKTDTVKPQQTGNAGAAAQPSTAKTAKQLAATGGDASSLALLGAMLLAGAAFSARRRGNKR